jgi:hypothetical protein
MQIAPPGTSDLAFRCPLSCILPIRIAPAILAAVSVAFAFPPANAQQPQPAQSLRLYVLDCGISTPPNLDNDGLKPNEVADTRMVTPCFLIVHPRGSPDSALKDGVTPQKLNNFWTHAPPTEAPFGRRTV